MLSKALQAAAGNAGEATYIDDVFSTWLYTGNGSTQTITNGIDLAGEGGMVWFKARTSGGSSFTNHAIIDTVRGKNANGYYSIYPNLTDAQFSPTGSSDAVATAVSSSGFTVGGNVNVNYNTQTDASWTFRKAPKFFDVVTWSGNGTTQSIAHSLGSVPGFIVIKRTDSAEDWWCFHRYDFTYRLKLNATNAAVNTNYTHYLGNNVSYVAPTSSTFTVGDIGGLNASGGTYVAYLFAHDAGGFGADGSENVISCGSFNTLVSTDVAVTLGYEPQFVLWKRAVGGTGNWNIADIMRGNSWTNWQKLYPNTTAAEAADTAYMCKPTPTGFIADQSFGYGSDNTIIYIAIRRPMKPPSSGTEVFSPYNTTSISLADAGSRGNGVGATAMYNMGFVTDAIFQKNKSSATDWYEGSRLQGDKYLIPNLTSAEASSVGLFWDSNKAALSYSGTYGTYGFRRAPGFFDVVCYTGTGVARTVNHNLTVAPEMMIVKRRSAADAWAVYFGDPTDYLRLNDPQAAVDDIGRWNDTAPTATVFTVGTDTEVNTNGVTYVAYLFATVAGVSKVGSYTGNGSSQTINCGFTSGARFVLIKRTDSTGSWWTFDSARGIVAGNDPALQLNSTAAEVTSADAVDADSTGFVVNQEATCNLNVNAASYIFLSIS